MHETFLIDFAARSRSLETVLDPAEDAPLPPDRDPDECFEEWRDAFDSEEAFRDRLGFADHTVETARERFRAAASGGRGEVPPRFETAREVVDRAVEYDATTDPDSPAESDRDTPAGSDRDWESARSLGERRADSPFVDLLAPLATAVADRVSLESDFAPAARESLTDWLLDRLTRAFRHPLFILFKAHQRTEYPDVDFGDADGSTAVYDEFVAKVREAGYQPVFERYPLLAELLGVVADQWRGAVRRLDDRVSADRDALAEAFDGGDALGRIADVETLSDDPHGDGELVLGVEFERDCTVVYKPRSVAGEAAFGDLLGWVNDRAEVPALYAPTVLDRGEYGWMEFVRHRDCESAAGVERYYERMGALSALAFVLGSTDFHYENVVAMGDHPVIVDQETALSPRVEAENAPSSSVVSSLLEDSVLDTLLLPVTKGADGDDLGTSGLSDVSDEERRQKLPNFRSPNTDAMELTFDRPCRFDGRNLPRLDGEVCEAADHVAELKRGFREVATAITARRDDLLDPAGPLAAFEGSAVRYLPRPTGHYAAKLTESRYASHLRSGLERSLLLESLYEVFVPRGDDGGLRRLVPAEKAALERLTVPRFTVAATGRELRDGRGEPLGVTVDESPLEHARRRISDLDDHWVESQLRLVDLTLAGSTVSDPVAPPSDDRATVPGADSPREVVSAVVGLLEETATRRPDGTLRWAEPARSSPTDDLLVREPDADLYAGYAGAGLFLAAVAAVRDDEALADRSRRVLDAARTVLDTDALGIGGMTGRGSVAYGLATAGDLLGDPDLLDIARTVATATTRDEVAADEDLDVVAGSAGELLAQLAVYERTGDGAVLDRARWCGDRLLDAATETPAGYRVPLREEAGVGSATTGDAGADGGPRFAFAHGVGGMGSALVRLATVTGEEEYAEVGRDALAFDAELWRRGRDGADTSSDAGRSDTDGSDAVEDAAADSPDATVWGWCNGFAGVGTARVAVADAAPDERAADRSLLREGLQSEPSLEDSLCCGTTGRALFALDAGEAFDDPSLADRGADLFAEMLDRADREGRLRLANHLPTFPKLGLFTGATGVGYVALRFEARDAGVDLPNVARLE